MPISRVTSTALRASPEASSPASPIASRSRSSPRSRTGSGESLSSSRRRSASCSSPIRCCPCWRSRTSRSAPSPSWRSWGSVFVSLNNGVLGTVFAELFPTRVRTSGIGIPYAICAAIFGGTAPAAATWLQQAGGPLYIALYVMAVCVITLVTHLTLTPGDAGPIARLSAASPRSKDPDHARHPPSRSGASRSRRSVPHRQVHRAARSGRALPHLPRCRPARQPRDRRGAAEPAEAITEVHDPAYVEFLRTVYARWRQHPDYGPVAIPNVHPTHRMHRKPTELLGEFGWYSNSTSCPITEGTWPAVFASAQVGDPRRRPPVGRERTRSTPCAAHPAITPIPT